METLLSLLPRQAQKQQIYTCLPKSVAEASHVMVVRSSSDILSFFCMLQFSGKKLSTGSLKSRHRHRKRAEKLRGEEAALVKPPVYLQRMHIPLSCRDAAAVQLSSLGGRTSHTVSLEAGRRAGLHAANAGMDVGGFHFKTHGRNTRRRTRRRAAGHRL